MREKKQKLADSEADLVKRHRESKEKLEQQKRDLETRVAAFQQEKVTWRQPEIEFMPNYLYWKGCKGWMISRFRDNIVCLFVSKRWDDF